MSARAQMQVESASHAPHSFASARRSLSRGGCRCGGSAGLSGGCAECDNERQTSQHHAAHRPETPVGPARAPWDARLQDRTPEHVARTFDGPPHGHSFGAVRVSAPSEIYDFAGRTVPLMLFDGKPGKKQEPAKKTEAEPAKKARRGEGCYEKCGGAELGSAECALSPDGFPTDKVVTENKETNPCTRPCVETHEGSHVKDMNPICKQVHACLKGAGKDIKKQNVCLDAFEAKLSGIGKADTECKAYKAEEKCLNERKSKPECKTKDGQARWTEQLNRTKCYRACFCGE